MKRKLKIILTALSLLFIQQQSFAWGLLGHRIVGQIASSYLTPKAKTELKKILGPESLAMVSNWPDFIKSDSTFNYLGPWHYVNLPANMSLQDFNNFFDKDTSVDAFTKTNFLVRELKTNKLLDAGTKAMYVKLLIHIVGDLHQPMHLGHLDDRGGNAVKLMWFKEPVNLHSLWDESLIKFQELSYTEYADAINHPTKQEFDKIAARNLKENIWDTYQITNKIYSLTAADDRLSYKYNFIFLQDMNDQLLKGGIHLATVLNDVFGK